MENKAYQTQIKKLQVELLGADSQVDKGAAAHKLLSEKENAIQLLKKKLKIPSTQLIQTSELIDFEKEKEALTAELTDCKEKLLKFEEKEKTWEKDIRLRVENENILKSKQAKLEKELKEKNKEQQAHILSPPIQSGTNSLSQAMSQVSLRDMEIIGLENQNKILEHMAVKM